MKETEDAENIRFSKQQVISVRKEVRGERAKLLGNALARILSLRFGETEHPSGAGASPGGHPDEKTIDIGPVRSFARDDKPADVCLDRARRLGVKTQVLGGV